MSQIMYIVYAVDKQTVFTLPELEIFTIFSERILQCLPKPLMLIGAMIDYQIHDNAQSV